MEPTIGILFAFAALICWGFGDFLIQRSTRRFGDWETLFLITAFGAIILTPFVIKDLVNILTGTSILWLLLFIALSLHVAALFEFEALKRGKLAVTEPVMAIEVPVSAILAFIILKESVTLLQALVIALLLVGLILVSLRSRHFSKKAWLEKGVFIMVIGSIFMGASNFLVGLGSRVTNPLLTNWFINVVAAVICLGYMLRKNRLRKLLRDVKENPRLILAVSAFDNFAWIAFAFAMTLIPIAIAVAISESYIALAALLGLVINREKLLTRQKIGLVVSLASAVILAAITG